MIVYQDKITLLVNRNNIQKSSDLLSAVEFCYLICCHKGGRKIGSPSVQIHQITFVQLSIKRTNFFTTEKLICRPNWLLNKLYPFCSKHSQPCSLEERYHLIFLTALGLYILFLNNTLHYHKLNRQESYCQLRIISPA